MTTPLGRDVPLGDWTAYRQDSILKVLYDFRFSPFNPEGAALGVRPIATATNVPIPELTTLCDPLVARGLVERIDNRAYHITDTGVRFVLSILRNPLQDMP